MAGLSCAQKLHGQGHSSVLFDKGRGPGGRMSTRRMSTPLGEASFDHGAQYFTVRDPAFIARVALWAEAGQVAPWPPAGDDAWVGMPSMNTPIRAMADECDVRWNTPIDTLYYDGQWRLEGDVFDAVILSIPAEQVPTLACEHDASIADAARSAVSDPCWAVMAAFDSPLPIDSDRLTNLGILGSAVRNSTKPGRTGPEAWVLQATAEWSREHLEDQPAIIEQALLAALGAHIGTDQMKAIATSAHRWRYAKATALDRGAIWNAEIKLGACGDWLMGPRVEAAWLSGQRLAMQIGDC